MQIKEGLYRLRLIKLDIIKYKTEHKNKKKEKKYFYCSKTGYFVKDY